MISRSTLEVEEADILLLAAEKAMNKAGIKVCVENDTVKKEE